MNQDRTGPEILLSDASISASIFDTKGIYEIYPLLAGTFVFLGDEGQLAMNHLPHKIRDRGCRGIAFDGRQNRLLFWTKNEIDTIEFLRNAPDNDPFSNGSVIQRIFEGGRNIQQCLWIYEGSHILFRDANKVFLAELMPQGPPHIEFLVQVKNNTDIFFSKETGAIYYLDAKMEGLQALDILSGKTPAALPPAENREPEEKS
jgi:hypothetical protein